MDNPHLNIIGHPTGRLIHEREPYPMRMEEVLDSYAAGAEPVSRPAPELRVVTK